MSQAVGDLVVNLDVNSTRFREEVDYAQKTLKGTGQAANDAALQMQRSFSKQEQAAKRAGLSVGQYSNAMRMLPAQFTDVATQLAGGQNPWLSLLQQGGQVKDSFGGLLPMFRGLVGGITPAMLGVGALATATGALAYSFYQGSATLSDFNKTLVLSGNSAGLTAQQMLNIAASGEKSGVTFNQASEALTGLMNAGVLAGANFEDLTLSVARFTDASGLPVDKVAEAFGRLVSDPSSGLLAMARQFHNVTAEQIAHVAALQRSGDAAGALQAANEVATAGFNRQTTSLRDNMGTVEKVADSLSRSFKSMWDAALDIGRPDTSEQMLQKAQDAFARADNIWKLRKGDAFVNDDARARYWTDREQARLALDMAQQQSKNAQLGAENAKHEATAEADRLKYAQQAQANYSKTQSALEKYTARQNELNKALKDGRILQADYNTNLDAAKKEYEDTLKKPPKTKAYTEDAGVRLLDQLNRQNEALQQQTRTTNTLTGAAQERIRFERTIADLKEKTQLSAEQKSLLAMSDQLLVAYRMQESLTGQVNTLHDFQKMQTELQDKEEKLRDVTAERLALLEKMKATGKVSPEEYDETSRRIADHASADLPRDIERLLRQSGSRGSLAGTMEGDFGQLDQLNGSAQSLEKWYTESLESLKHHRQQRADLNGQWDAQELALKQQHALAEQNIEAQKNQIVTQATQSGLNSMIEITRVAFGEKSGIYKATFIADKAYAIAQSTLAIQTGIAQAAANPFPYNLVAMASVAAATASIVSNIQSVGLVGMAHDGIDNVPETGTWLLQKGERVTSASTSVKLDRTLESISKQRETNQRPVNYSPAFHTTGVPDGRTLEMMEAMAKREGDRAYGRVLNETTTGNGKMGTALRTKYRGGRIVS